MITSSGIIGEIALIKMSYTQPETVYLVLVDSVDNGGVHGRFAMGSDGSDYGAILQELKDSDDAPRGCFSWYSLLSMVKVK